MLLGGIWPSSIWIMIPTSASVKIFIRLWLPMSKPIQLSTFDNQKVIAKRKEFSRDEWVDVLLRSCGYEPGAEGITDRVKMLLLARLLPDGGSQF